MPDGATVKTSKAAIGFRYCNKLFAEERKCVLYKPQYRKEYCQNKEGQSSCFPVSSNHKRRL